MAKEIVPEFDKEKTGVVIVDHGSVKEESNLRLDELVELFRQTSPYRLVQPAHMELATPTILDAFKECQKHEVQLVVVSPFFLLPGKHWQQDIPRLSAEASKACGDIPYFVSAPLGVHRLLVDVMNSRIEHCANQLLNEPTDWSNLQNRCNCCSERVNCGTHGSPAE